MRFMRMVGMWSWVGRVKSNQLPVFVSKLQESEPFTFLTGNRIQVTDSVKETRPLALGKANLGQFSESLSSLSLLRRSLPYSDGCEVDRWAMKVFGVKSVMRSP